MTQAIFRNSAQSAEKQTAIEKALSILKMFGNPDQEFGTIEISRMLGYHKATTSRTLLLLAKHGFLSQNPVTRKYQLGPVPLSLNVKQNIDLEKSRQKMVEIAIPLLNSLRDRYEESVVLEMMTSNHVTIRYISKGPKMMPLDSRVGAIQPVNSTAGAKSILAFSSSAIRDTFVQRKLEQLTPNTITDHMELYIEYERTKQRGYSLDKEEFYDSVSAIGAPILNKKEQAVAAVVMSGQVWDIDMSKNSSMITAVRETALEITNKAVMP